ncbi:hypothetical protein O181_039939 [Austropuccinia psidii MF-1]|uniref:Uncharacterized protein n=1 Tax=Austropuccinia psidii MF-1 TaxID=1389203 RepID=A0A9Q3DB99_9BASI|nr:hypothetical protein [Austropuccinia psidii MF-1]
MDNLSKQLEGGHELLLTHQEPSESAEDHRNLRRIESLVLEIQGQKYKELVEEPKSFLNRPKGGTRNSPSFGERKTSSVKKLQASCINIENKVPKDLRRNREVPRTIIPKPIGTDLTNKCTGFLNWNLQLWKVYLMWPEPLCSSQPTKKKDEQTFPRK